MVLTRRDFLISAALAPLAASRMGHAEASRYRVGITTNTRGGWENDVFLSFREAREVGYRHVESFVHYFSEYFDKPEELRKKMDAIGVRFVTISNGGPMEMHFEDPAKHEKLIEDHLRLVRFIKRFGCKGTGAWVTSGSCAKIGVRSAIVNMTLPMWLLYAQTVKLGT